MPKRTKALEPKPPVEPPQVTLTTKENSRLYMIHHGRRPPASIPFRQRALSALGSLIGVKVSTVLKDQRTAIPTYIFESAPTILEPAHDQIEIFDKFQKNWVTRQISRAIRQEVIGTGFSIVERFAVKCTRCGKEFESPVEECDVCTKKDLQSDLRDPDQSEFQIGDSLITRPNPSYNFRALIDSALIYLISLDDFYLSIVYGREVRLNPEKEEPVKEEIFFEPSEETEEFEPKAELVLRPREVYVEDTRFIRPIADKFGHLGNDVFFCPICYDADSDSPKVILELSKVLTSGVPHCEKCNGEMIQTVWVQAVGEKVIARLGRDEVVHGSAERVLPELFGSPKVISLIKLMDTIEAMDEYNLGVYSEGKTGSIVTFPNMEQDDVNIMLTKVNQALEEKEKQDLKDGKLIAKKKIRTVVLGVKDPPVRLETLEKLKDMQSLEFYKLYVEKICSVFGVTPVFVSIIESGKAGNNPRMQIDVQNRTTRFYQQLIEQVINEQLFPLLGIYDWLFKFDEIEQRDELRDAQIHHAKATAASVYVNAGFDVKIDEEGEIEVSGDVKGRESPEGVPSPRGVGQVPTSSPRIPEISEASGAVLEGKSVGKMTTITKSSKWEEELEEGEQS